MKFCSQEVDFVVNPVIPDNDAFTRAADYLNPIMFGAFTILSGKETKQGGIFSFFKVLGPKVSILFSNAQLTEVFLQFSNFLPFSFFLSAFKYTLL